MPGQPVRSMPSRVMRSVRDIARAAGFDVVRYQPTSHYLARRAQLLRAHSVDLVLDVGANDGQYAAEIRRFGYQGRIVSFEPLPDAVERLKARRAADAAWEIRGVALGDEPGMMTINIAGNSASSSLLPMLPAHERYAPGTSSVGETRVPVQRLDEIAEAVLSGADRPFLKIDTQGFEARVLDGASTTLDQIAGVQIEISIVPLYAGAPLAMEMLERVGAYGFELMGIEPGFSDADSGRLLQFDGVFFRPELTSSAI